MSDYIHLVALAKGHVKAVEKQLEKKLVVVHPVNLGSGKGISVLEMVNASIEQNKVGIPYQYVDRRPGDVASYYADLALAKPVLEWQTELDVNDMVKDSWNWRSQNPEGYL